MSDVELVIKIDDKLYDRIKYLEPKADTTLDKLMRSVQNGTLLPKGHGVLKDFDKIEWNGCDFEGRGCIEAKGDCSVCNYANCDAKQVRDLPTIIEADKEENAD